METSIREMHIPMLPPSRFPEAEREAIDDINLILSGLSKHTECFADALAIFDYASAELQKLQQTDAPTPEYTESWISTSYRYTGWMNVAARDGAMTIDHIGKLVEELIDKKLQRSPALHSSICENSLSTTRECFKEAFPGFTADGKNKAPIRNNIAHPPKTLEEFCKHSFNGDYTAPGINIENSSGIFIHGLSNRHFTTTRHGKIQRYEISQQTLDILYNVVNGVYYAFAPAEKAWRDSISQAVAI